MFLFIRANFIFPNFLPRRFLLLLKRRLIQVSLGDNLLVNLCSPSQKIRSGILPSFALEVSLHGSVRLGEFI